MTGHTRTTLVFILFFSCYSSSADRQAHPGQSWRSIFDTGVKVFFFFPPKFIFCDYLDKNRALMAATFFFPPIFSSKGGHQPILTRTSNASRPLKKKKKKKKISS
jgi:hypothetical protein